MSWYSIPIQPIDPVVVSQTPKPPIRYMRDNFAGTGQNSYVQPPSQDQSMWQTLTNTMPITQGVINPRWGYNEFATLAGAPNRLYDFQSDLLGTRAIIAAGPNLVSSYTEAGLAYADIFTPSAPSGSIIRSITSRNFQYFCDGNNALNPTTHLTGDSLKWNGNTNGGVSNIGILVSDVTSNNASGGSSGGGTIGPNYGTEATDLTNSNGQPNPSANPWTNPSGALSATVAGAAHCPVTALSQDGLLISDQTQTDYLELTDFFTSASGAAVLGLQTNFSYSATAFNGATPRTGVPAFATVQIIKNGVLFGTPKTVNLLLDGNTHNVTLGGANILWGGTYTPDDLIQSNFGFQVFYTIDGWNLPSGVNVTSGFTIRSYGAQMVATLSAGSGISSNSGNGIGIVSEVGGGDVTLAIGRTYYLVANNSTTGHFSDLTSPSASSGPVGSSELTLVLSTFNDPQVDTKYVVATADGGDPSILYEVQVLAPGLTVSSWAIVSNVVTFTGTWQGGTPGPTYLPGVDYFRVGGLSHGSYMNNQVLLITATTNSTLSAAFTHGNDSATELGICGRLTFAVGNDIAVVVDNTPDPDLVTYQPLLYTDNSGNEYGVTLNDPPPAGNLLIKNQGRLWMAGVSGATHSIFFSKSVDELTLPDGFIAGKYEEAWPGSNYFDVSDGAESVAGLLTDGNTLYIGTQNHIRRLVGNSPSNFQEPEIVHPEVGLINQEVWQIVFMQGAPSGSIWLTPDYKVIQSDFNTYVDIGTPIQNILNNLQSTAPSLAHAAYVADGEYDLYILAVPYQESTYCDVHLVFDLRARQWSVWYPAFGSLSLLYNVTQQAVPQWLFIGGLGANGIWIYSSTATTDATVIIPVTATTTWMHLGEPTRRKMLNEVQIYGNTEMLLTVNGANNLADFNSPKTIVYNHPFVRNVFDTWTNYLVSFKSKHRYYQFTFTGYAGTNPLLGSYSISSMPMDDL